MYANLSQGLLCLLIINMQEQSDLNQIIWEAIREKYAQSKMDMLKSGTLTLNNRTMKFVYSMIGDRPQQGYNLIFGFHGGGGVPAQKNDQQYENHKKYYNGKLPQGSIWFTPRSVQNISNMWHRHYMEAFILEIIRAFTLNGIVNPNKVFLTGYSAGGDGIYHMAPRMADYLAGAAMMAGHPNKVCLINIRNIHFSIHLGEHDKAYNRNNQAIHNISCLNTLGKNYGGYKHSSKIYKNKGHGLEHQQCKSFKQLFCETRNPYPNVILFMQHPVNIKQTFYYIRLEDLPKDGVKKHLNNELTIVIRNGNDFKILSNRVVTVMVNRKMIDKTQPINIIHNNAQSLSHQFMKVREEIMIQSANSRLDPEYIFEDQFTSVPKKLLQPQQFKNMICQTFKLSPKDMEGEYRQSSPPSKYAPK